jgi:hypothetical protein
MWNVWEAGEVHTDYWYGDLRKRGHLEDLDVEKRITVKWLFIQWDVREWTGLIWLRIETGGGLL